MTVTDMEKRDVTVDHVDKVSSSGSDEDVHRVTTQAKGLRVDGDEEDHMHEPPVSLDAGQVHRRKLINVDR